MIYSEQVPRGNGEKQPGEGDEIVSETVCLQWAGVRNFSQEKLDDGIPIEEWACECAMCRLPKGRKVRRRRETKSE